MRSNINRIYYFSGTGNSLRAATVIAQVLGNTEIISMRCDPSEVSAADSDIIGFVFPVYHWTICEAIQDFISALKINSDAYIFAVSTPAFINGFSFETLNKLLDEKGAKLQYAKRVFSVANLCIVYPPFPSPRLRVPATERKLIKVSRMIQKRATNAYAKAGWLTRLIYPKMMPKYRAIQAEVDKGFFVSDNCISCGVCSKVCPKTNITMKNSRPTFLHDCSCCMACVSFCPKKAIKYGLPPEQLQKINTLFMRMMRLPDKRKRYHNPHISANDLMIDRKYIH
ncbi:MAG: EFR1 family ferrodoxin [Oscillospiraceae bacterium]|jgi:formate hydrogenlyase subunit 6/NADH:ubiquinone oxidoreductase subunit I|nr:EFR1 family ferrodoxin [Oscillospiraceae bacterium]